MMDPRIILDVIADLERQRDALDRLILRLRGYYNVARERPANGRWTAAEDDLAEHMVTVEGKTHAEVAALLGRTTLAVSQRLSRRTRS